MDALRHPSNACVTFVRLVVSGAFVVGRLGAWFRFCCLSVASSCLCVVVFSISVGAL